ncbi:hypothetical protein F5877DRAFT_81239 [Lentinula edodes]|nr:hypothetical protein F5877DRAFT_81239 [Lentinula edodes]
MSSGPLLVIGDTAALTWLLLSSSLYTLDLRGLTAHLVALARLHGVHDLNSLRAPSNITKAPQRLNALLRDLDLSNIEATPHVELRIASPLPPPTLEDVHPQAQSPGTYPPGHIPSQELTPSRPIYIYGLLNPILTF